MTVSAYTANYRLRKLTYNSRGWHTDEWFNLDLIDGLLSGIGASIPFVGVPTGTVDAIVLNFTPDITYTTGQQISFVATGANTGAVTVNCDGLGAKSLKSAAGAALTAGRLTTGMYVRAIYNGTDFTCIFPLVSSAANIFTTNASGVTSPVDADDLIVENNVDVGLSLNTAAGYKATLNFGKPLSPSVGRIQYNHATDEMTFSSNGAVVGTLNATGRFTLLASTGYTVEPGQPIVAAWHAYGVGSLPTTTNPIIFDTETIDTRNAYNNATGIFTAPVDGTYHIDYSFGVFATAACYTKIQKNGADISSQLVCPSFGADNADIEIATQRMLVNLVAGDTLRVLLTVAGTVTKWKGNLNIFRV